MHSKSRFLLAVAGLALCGCGLHAQELRYGLQATVAVPTCDLAKKAVLDDALGYGLGAHMVIGFQGGHAIVPRLDYTYFEKGDPTRKVQMLQVGADYNYYFSRVVNRGLYVSGGGGFTMAKFDLKQGVLSDDDTPTTAYASAGVGYMFTPHLGAELRYTWAEYKPELFGHKPELTTPTVGASFLYRF